MNDFWSSIFFSVTTGIVSSSLVVLYFEFRQARKHALSRAHILQRFETVLFGILTAVRVTAKLNHPTSQTSTLVFKDLEKILGRINPSVLLSRIGNLQPVQHRYIIEHLARSQDELSQIFSDSISHKTIEDNVSASIAEMQGWVNEALLCYMTFPEIIEGGKNSEMMHTFWLTKICNLVENTFAILAIVLKEQSVPDGDLRWGSRSKQ